MATISKDRLCSIGTVQIPRPKCQGFQFINTRGRMGFYRSIKRDGEKYGIQMKNMGPRRPQLPDATFWNPKSEDENKINQKKEEIKVNNNENDYDKNSMNSSRKSSLSSMYLSSPPSKSISNQSNYQENDTFTHHFDKIQSSTLSKRKGSLPAVPIKNPPPAPPLPDLTKLPPRPPKASIMKKKSEIIEPPIDYNDNGRQYFRRQAPIMNKHQTIPEETENDYPTTPRKSTTRSMSSERYCERL